MGKFPSGSAAPPRLQIAGNQSRRSSAAVRQEPFCRRSSGPRCWLVGFAIPPYRTFPVTTLRPPRISTASVDAIWFQALQQVAKAIGILNVGRMDEDAEQQPVRVHRDVPLAPLQPLRGIPTARAAALRGLYTLGVDDCCRGTGFPPSALTEHDHEVVADTLPHPVSQEGAHIAVHGVPGRKGRRWRQMPPLTAGAYKVEEAIQQLSHIRGPRPPTALGGRDERLQ